MMKMIMIIIIINKDDNNNNESTTSSRRHTTKVVTFIIFDFILVLLCSVIFSGVFWPLIQISAIFMAQLGWPTTSPSARSHSLDGKHRNQQSYIHSSIPFDFTSARSISISNYIPTSFQIISLLTEEVCWSLWPFGLGVCAWSMVGEGVLSWFNYVVNFTYI